MDPALHLHVSAADAGDLLAAVHPDPRLAHHRPRGLHGLHLHPHLDRSVPRSHHHSSKVQERIIYCLVVKLLNVHDTWCRGVGC